MQQETKRDKAGSEVGIEHKWIQSMKLGDHENIGPAII